MQSLIDYLTFAIWVWIALMFLGILLGIRVLIVIARDDREWRKGNYQRAHRIIDRMEAAERQGR